MKNKRKVIEKKILPECFGQVIEGNKKFKLGKDEDNAQPGDMLILKECSKGMCTGQKAVRIISYVTRNKPEYGLQPGYCIIGWR